MACGLPYDIQCLTSRKLHEFTVPRLYRGTRERVEHGGAQRAAGVQVQLERVEAGVRARLREILMPWQGENSRLFLDSIIGNANLGQHVRAIGLGAVDATAPQFCAALRRMPLLQHLNMEGTEFAFACCPVDVVEAIAELQHLDSIHLCSMTTFDLDILLDRLPPMNKINCWPMDDRIPGLGRLLLRSIATLESLDALGPEYLEDFLDQNGHDRVWLRLRALNVCELLSVSPAYAFPNLQQLSVGLHSDWPTFMLQDQTYFPSLDQLSLILGDFTLTPSAFHLDKSSAI